MGLRREGGRKPIPKRGGFYINIGTDQKWTVVLWRFASGRCAVGGEMDFCSGGDIGEGHLGFAEKGAARRLNRCRRKFGGIDKHPVNLAIGECGRRRDADIDLAPDVVNGVNPITNIRNGSLIQQGVGNGIKNFESWNGSLPAPGNRINGESMNLIV